MQRIGAIIAALALLLLTRADAQTPDSVPGCVYNATPPTLTTGQVVEWQCDINGKLITSGGGGGGGSPGGVSGNVQTNDGAGGFGGLTDTQLTARINAATTALSGALPAWPNNSTTFLRGDGTYAAVGFSAITGFGTGVATALGINVGQAGALVTMNGALGTPSSGTLTSATGLPISTGLTGAGTGVLTALGVNVGSAGAPVLFNGAGGTPSSLALANATGCTISGCVSGLGTGVATLLGGASSGTGGPAGTTSPTFTTPALGAATGTSLALGGCTIGANALCATGTAAISSYINTEGISRTYNVSSVNGWTVATGAADDNGLYSTGLSLNSVSLIKWNSTNNLLTGATDTTLSRNAAGIIQFGTTTSNASGSFLATNGTFSGQMSAATLAGAAFGTGVATFLGTPSSANLLAAMTTKTGTGNLVFATSPTLVTPEIGLATSTGNSASTSLNGLSNITLVNSSFTNSNTAGIKAVNSVGGDAAGLDFIYSNQVTSPTSRGTFNMWIQNGGGAKLSALSTDTSGNLTAPVSVSTPSIGNLGFVAFVTNPTLRDSTNGASTTTFDTSFGGTTDGGFVFRSSSNVHTLFQLGNGTTSFPFMATTGTTDGYVCHVSGGQIINDAGTCLPSARDTKNILADYSPADALSFVSRMKAYEFTYKDEFVSDANKGVKFVGGIADEIEALDSRFVAYDKEGKARSIRGDFMYAANSLAIQALLARIEILESQVAGAR